MFKSYHFGLRFWRYAKPCTIQLKGILTLNFKCKLENSLWACSQSFKNFFKTWPLSHCTGIRSFSLDVGWEKEQMGLSPQSSQRDRAQNFCPVPTYCNKNAAEPSALQFSALKDTYGASLGGEHLSGVVFDSGQTWSNSGCLSITLTKISSVNCQNSNEEQPHAHH